MFYYEEMKLREVSNLSRVTAKKQQSRIRTQATCLQPSCLKAQELLNQKPRQRMAVPGERGVVRAWVGGSTSPLREHLGCFVGERWRSGAPRQGWGGRSLRKEQGLKDQFFVSRTEHIRAFSHVQRFFLWLGFPEKI